MTTLTNSRKIRTILISLFAAVILFSSCKSQEERLLNALIDEDTDKIQKILKAGADTNYIFPLYKYPIIEPFFIYRWLADESNLNENEIPWLTGFTPLTLSFSNDIITLLLNSGAELEISLFEDKAYQMTALAAALYGQNVDVAEMLIEKGAEVNLSLPGKMSTLMLAAQANHMFKSHSDYTTEIVQELLEAGADVHQIAHDGSTALHFAVDNGQIESVRLLLGEGVNPNIINNDGKTALSMAREEEYDLYRRSQLVDLLIEYGATE